MYFLRPLLVALFFVLTPFVLQAQLFGGPQKTARAFIKALNKGNYEKAAGYCILDLKEDMSGDFQRMERRQERVMIELYDCENVETEYGVDCECVTYFSGRSSILVFSMVDVDGTWKIHNLDSRTANRDEKNRNPKKNKSQKPAKLVEPESPAETLTKFASYNAKGAFKKSEQLTIMEARLFLLKQLDKETGSLPVSITNIACYESEKDYKVTCNCDQKTADGKEETGYYDLGLIDGNWKILEYGRTKGAEAIVARFVQMLARGNCEQAKILAIDNAVELVQGSIDAGCVSYPTEIISVTCDYETDSTFCFCTEKRDGMEMRFIYVVKEMDGRWLVSDYKKDFEMDSDGEAVMEDVEVMPIEAPPVETQERDSDDAVAYPEVEASFPGGMNAMVEYLSKSIVYPETSKAQGVSGTVYLKFVVREDGSITDVVVVRGVNQEIDAEALRVVRAMPAWTPGMANGKNIASYFTLPIRFELTR